MKGKFGINRKAYSLIELSIVLVIISVLVAGAMTVSVENLKSDQIRITKERMAVIYDRVGHSLMVDRKIPCPASLTKVKSSDNYYGVSATTCYSSTVGAVPVTSLGLPAEYAEDAFGSKFIYFVSAKTTASPSDTTSTPDFLINTFSTLAHNQFTATTPDVLFTIQENQTGSRQTITTGAVFGIISLGPNKFGAYNANSLTQNTTLSSDADEQLNYNSTTTTFISSALTSSSFDDIVFYKTMKDIIADYPDLMYLVPCKVTDIPGYSSTWYDTGTKDNAWYGGIAYSKKRTDCAADPNIRYSFKCVENGKWATLVNVCPTSGADMCTISVGNVGTGAYSSTAQNFSAGTNITLTCRNGYGRVIDGVTDTITSTTSNQLCDRTITDRSGTLVPTAVCSNGAIQVINDCTACRNCTDTVDSTIYDGDGLYSADNSCNTFSWWVSEIIHNCNGSGGISAVSYTVNHLSTQNFGVVRERKCKVSGTCTDHERNACVGVTLQCVDGRFRVTWGGDANIGNESTSCGTTYKTCNRYSVSDNC